MSSSSKYFEVDEQTTDDKQNDPISEAVDMTVISECKDIPITTGDCQLEGSTADSEIISASSESCVTAMDAADDSTSDSTAMFGVSESPKTSIKTEDDQSYGLLVDLVVSDLISESAGTADVPEFADTTMNTSGDDQNDGSSADLFRASLLESFGASMDTAGPDGDPISESVEMTAVPECTKTPGDRDQSTSDFDVVCTFPEPSDTKMDTTSADDSISGSVHMNDSLECVETVMNTENQNDLSTDDNSDTISILTKLSGLSMNTVSDKEHDGSISGIIDLEASPGSSEVTMNTEDNPDEVCTAHLGTVPTLMEPCVTTMVTSDDRDEASSNSTNMCVAEDTPMKTGDEQHNELSSNLLFSTLSEPSEITMGTAAVHADDESTTDSIVAMSVTSESPGITTANVSFSPIGMLKTESSGMKTECDVDLELVISELSTLHTESDFRVTIIDSSVDQHWFSDISEASMDSVGDQHEESAFSTVSTSTGSIPNNKGSERDQAASVYSFVGLPKICSGSALSSIYNVGSASNSVEVTSGSLSTGHTMDFAEGEQVSSSSFVSSSAFSNISRNILDTVNDQEDMKSDFVSSYPFIDTFETSIDDIDFGSLLSVQESLASTVGTCDSSGIPNVQDQSVTTVGTCDSSGIPNVQDQSATAVGTCDSSGIPNVQEQSATTVVTCDSSGLPNVQIQSATTVGTCDSSGILNVQEQSATTVGTCDSSGLPNVQIQSATGVGTCGSSGLPYVQEQSVIVIGTCDSSGIPNIQEQSVTGVGTCDYSGILNVREQSSTGVGTFDSSGLSNVQEQSASKTGYVLHQLFECASIASASTNTDRDNGASGVVEKPPSNPKCGKSEVPYSEGMRLWTRSMIRRLAKSSSCLGGNSDKRRKISSSTSSSEESTSSCTTFIEHQISTNSSDSAKESSSPITRRKISEHRSSEDCNENLPESSRKKITGHRTSTSSDEDPSPSKRKGGYRNHPIQLPPKHDLPEVVQGLMNSLLKPLAKYNCDIAVRNVQAISNEYFTCYYEVNHLDNLLRDLMEQYQKKIEEKREGHFEFLNVPEFCRLKCLLALSSSVVESYKSVHSMLRVEAHSMSSDNHYLQNVLAILSNGQLTLDFIGEISEGLGVINTRMELLSTWIQENREKYALFFTTRDKILTSLVKF